MTDTAEYWNDINNGMRKRKRVFTHATNYDCGHFHVHESNKIALVDCFACITHLKSVVKNYDEIVAAHHEKKRKKHKH